MSDQEIAVIKRIGYLLERWDMFTKDAIKGDAALFRATFWRELGDRRSGEQRREDRRKPSVEKREKEAAK